MSKWFWIILGATVAALVGIFLLTSSNSSDQASQPNSNPAEVSSTDHIEGDPDAKVTLIEYGDFQCPACGASFPHIKQLRAEYDNRVRFVFRHFPLASIHPNAFPAARE